MALRSSNRYKPSTGPFEIQRGVRQGDPLSPYLVIIVLEVLAISIRKNKDIQGIVVDGIEIKLKLFADDLTVFLIGLLDTYLLGNSVMALAQDQSIMNIDVKGQLTPQNELFLGQITSNVKVKNPHFRAERASLFQKFPLENLTYIALTAAVFEPR